MTHPTHSVLNPYTQACLYGPNDTTDRWQESKSYRHLCDVLEEEELKTVFAQEMVSLALVSELPFGNSGFGAMVKAQQEVRNSPLMQQALARQAKMRLETLLKTPGPSFLPHVAQVLPFLKMDGLIILDKALKKGQYKDQEEIFSNALKESLYGFLIGKTREKEIDILLSLSRKCLPSDLNEEVHFLALLGDADLFMDAVESSLTNTQVKKNVDHVYRILHRREEFIFGIGELWKRSDGLPFLEQAVNKWGADSLSTNSSWFKIDYFDSFQSNIQYYKDVCGLLGKDVTDDTQALGEIFQIDFTSLVDTEEYLDALQDLSPPPNITLSFETGAWSREYTGQLDYHTEEIKNSYAAALGNPLTPHAFLTASYCLNLACGHTVDPPPSLQFFCFPSEQAWAELLKEQQHDDSILSILRAFKNNYENLKMKHDLQEELSRQTDGDLSRRLPSKKM